MDGAIDEAVYDPYIDKRTVDQAVSETFAAIGNRPQVSLSMGAAWSILGDAAIGLAVGAPDDEWAWG